MLLLLSWAREKVETAILALVWMMVMYWSGCMPGKVCMGCGGHEQCPKRRHFSRKNGQLEFSFQVTRLVILLGDESGVDGGR
jgi:hypothetical protein